MRLGFLTFLVFVAPALLPGQDKGIGTVLYPGPSYTEVKQYLNLTDAQLQSLQTIVNNRNQVIQNIYAQISQKYEALYQMMNSDSGTAAQLGQFLIDIRNLQKQLPLNDGPYKTQAQAVLTTDQKGRLPKLAEALQLQNTAYQAGSLLLIDLPQYSGPPLILSTGAMTPETTANTMMAPRGLALPPVIR
jgi:hypothetical protein